MPMIIKILPEKGTLIGIHKSQETVEIFQPKLMFEHICLYIFVFIKFASRFPIWAPVRVKVTGTPNVHMIGSAGHVKADCSPLLTDPSFFWDNQSLATWSQAVAMSQGQKLLLGY